MSNLCGLRNRERRRFDISFLHFVRSGQQEETWTEFSLQVFQPTNGLIKDLHIDLEWLEATDAMSTYESQLTVVSSTDKSINGPPYSPQLIVTIMIIIIVDDIITVPTTILPILSIIAGVIHHHGHHHDHHNNYHHQHHRLGTDGWHNNNLCTLRN